MQTILKSHKTKLLRIVLIVFLLNLASVSFIINSNIFVISPLDNNSNSINLPKTSDNEITIVTPENKTYTGPMSGYYPATYGFENDNFGEIPYNWNDLSGTGCSVEVVDDIYDHKKIIQLNDNSGNAAMVEIFFPYQETGIIEWWWLSTDVDKWTNFVLYQGSTIAILLEIALSSFRYSDGSYNTVVSGILDNSWYKNKIDFDVSTDTFNWYIYYNNGSLLASILNADFHNSVNDINHLRTATNSGQSGFQTYIDAVGFSWDLNYNIGDNMKEGLLLSYENSTNLDWMGYSLDGGANKTITGNTTIPLPFDGPHDIQVFGNNSFGSNFQSNIRYFSVYHLIINTPENKTYTGPMSGYYPATYGFENDNFGEIPYNWNDLSGTGCSVEVVDEIYDHKKVIQLNDNSGNAAMVEIFFPNQETGIIEWWWLSTDVDKWTNFVLYQGSTIAILLEIALSSFRYHAGSYNTVVSGILDNSWYKNKIDFDVSTDTFNWYIYYNNGSLLASILNADFHKSVNDINHLRTATNSGQSGFQTYIDAVGFSWDLNYNIGDNMKEGLLLSYENSTNLDWKRYSLDGLENKTILGNTTIPLPGDGYHNIQVFGNDSTGRMYNSEIQYFSVDTLAPIITINSPLINEFFSGTSPTFDLSIIEPNLNTSWYSLDDGITNINFSGLTGSINSVQWNLKSDGPVTIIFYSNDSFGCESSESITVNKDTINPIIDIITPANGAEYNVLPPNYEITYTEINLDSVWYTLDGGTTNIPITGVTGSIDSFAWNNTPIGAVTIRFYISDKAGNIEYQEITVIKSEPPQEPPPGIPGFDVGILALILVGTIISIIIVRKKKIK